MEHYLKRIGYTGNREPDLENLSRLTRLHLETVPFDTLDFYGNPCILPLEIQELYDKVVTRNRGGVCCELNHLFCWLLKGLGFQAVTVMARILMGPGEGRICHACNLVEVDGRRYYCDVGFGGPGPKGLVCIDDPGVQVVYGEAYRVTRKGNLICIEKDWGDRWGVLLELIDVPATQGDLEVILYAATAKPDAHFVHNRAVNLCQPDGYLALNGNVFTGRRNGESFRREVPEEQIPELLAKEFGLVIGS